MTEEFLNFDKIKTCVNQALSDFKNNESDLLNPLGREENLAQRFSFWLQRQFPEWIVDCEYSLIRDGMSKAKVRKVTQMLMRRVSNKIIRLDEPEEVVVVPDIIIHHRGTSENLLVIELKTSNDKSMIEFDKEKLRAYKDDERLGYQYALFLKFKKLDEESFFVDEIEYL